MPFKSLWIRETPEGKFERSIILRDIDDLPSGEVLIRVIYSALNYKDALSATGNKGITKKYPHTPGVDAAGIVEISRSEQYAVGEEVIVTGYDLGMNTSGGLAGYIRVPAAWLVPKPEEYTLKECMVIGTAGFTAAFALHKMEQLSQSAGNGPLVVTGATGGVGSLAVAILAKAGYEVIAVTGKTNAKEYLEFLGSSRVASRDFVDDRSGKLLIRPQWAGAIDTVGGNILSTLLKGCKQEGCVVSTGLVGSSELITSVFPFILNGVSLLGVGTAETSMQLRQELWQKLATVWNIRDKLEAIGKEVSMEEMSSIYIDAILKGNVTGRIIVRTWDE
jgi:putative YhdH/YhfP family quinone oxidoreductase